MEKKNKMKKIFKNLFIFSLMCVFSSCEFFTDSFNAPVKEFFRDNTEAAAIELFEFSSETYKNSITEKLTVSSLQDANVVLYLRNPREYNFITSENMTSTFGSFLHSEYYLVQDENDKKIINLSIPKELLEKTEIESRNTEYNKSQNILIKLFHPVSKAEFLPFTLEFDCDTIPPSVFSPVYYITTSSYPNSSMQNYYVIAFNMPKKSEVCSLGVHNDLSKLVINKKEYSISITDDGTIKFPNNSGIIAGDVNTIEGIEPINIKFVTQDDYQPFYIVTDTQISIEGAEATLSLVDKGNFSSKINISSNSRMLGKVLLKANDKVFTSETEVIEVNQEVNESYANITIIPPSVSVDLNGEEDDVSDVFVKYTIKNLDTREIFRSGVNNGKDSVQIKIPSGKYSIECVAQKDNYADSITTFKNIQIKGSLFNFYVASGANDSNADGSITKPFKTIQAALNKIYERNMESQSSSDAPYKLILLTDISESDINIEPDSELYLTIKSKDNNNKIDAQNNGKVMTIADNAFVTLENVTLTNGCSQYGGGVEVSGELTLSDNCIISNNTVTSSGYGAGIYLKPNAKLTMNGGTIENNSGSDFGGGVYLEDKAEFVMNRGEISQNSAKNGGGVCVAGGTFEMNGGSISNNTAYNNGSGVYVVKHTNSEGEGFSPTFNISGDAYIEDNNDVYLTAKQKITITGNLSTTGIVATITPENYAEKYEENYEENYKEVQVLAAGEGITLTEQQVEKFNVTKYNNNNNVETKITETGFLKNTLTLGENPELTEDLYNICSTINVSTADGMKELSTLSPPENAGNPGQTFKGKTINLKAHVILDTEYKPIHTFSGVFDGGGYSIEINAPTIYDWDSPKGTALFYIVKGENAEIKDLTVYGTADGAGIAHTLTEKAKISNCKSYVNITTQKQSYPTPGGIVSNLNNGSRIENCENYGTIICDGENTGGGIVGDMGSVSNEPDAYEYPVIANCTNYGVVTINDATINDAPVVVKMGGICGWINFGTIFNCANKGKVSVTDNKDGRTEILGGIVGHCYGTKIEGIINCYNSGEIYGSSNCADQNIGGIVGMYSYNSAVVQVPKFVNTVNNFDQILSFGTLEQIDDANTKNNYYKKAERSTNYHPYEKTFANNIDTVINTLNAYSNTNRYLIWGKDSDGNIVFSKDISDNQGNTP